jgi:outer membrane protein TolC
VRGCALRFFCAQLASSQAQDQEAAARIKGEIRLAEYRIQASSVWMRLRPTVSFSASVGVTNALIYEPTTTILLPRDSYRLTLSIPISEIWMDGNEEAVLRKENLVAELQSLRDKEREQMEVKNRKMRELERELKILKSEYALLQDVVRYSEFLYSNGTLQFDALARARLQALGVERQILHLESQLAEF